MTTNAKKISVGIDGPAGSGKSTVSKLVAKRFDLSYVDTGAMYRCVGLLANRKGISPEDEPALSALAEQAVFDFRMDPDSPDLLNRVYLNGEEVTTHIREPEISSMASKVSALSGVRRILVARQQQMGRDGGVIMEGRDICNVVMPDAEVKIFLIADPAERAKRRMLELAAAGKNPVYDEVLSDIKERDHRDSTRNDSPLKPAPDSVQLDTTKLSISQVVDAISDIILKRIQ